METAPAAPLKFRPLTGAELLDLSEEELEEYESLVEESFWARGKDNLAAFCSMIEVPGAPIEAEEAEKFFSSKVKPAKHHHLIIDAIQKMADGEYSDIDGIMMFMPPGSAKSTYGSVIGPAWLLGRKPGTNVIATSYGDDLAQKFGRRVRTICKSSVYNNIMGCTVSGDNAAVNDWSLTIDSTYRASGLGGTITGIRADYMFIDDPVKNREEADSELIREKRWEAYLDDVQSRLKPGGKIFIIMCMVGDTPVLMADGSEKLLRDVRPGDKVATYDSGKVGASTVLNWANQGPDAVYEIRMKSGITVKANARHPFLVECGGRREWRQTGSIKPGDIILRATGASGEASRAQRMAVTSQRDAEGSACSTTIKNAGPMAIDPLPSTLSRVARRALNTATKLTQQSMTAFMPSREAFAPSVNALPATMCAHTGVENSALIIATAATRSVASCAMTATSPLGTERHPASCLPPLNIYEITTDEVVEVVQAGVEDVYDIQIERTENFIANGLVSHNTRWHEDDLCGRLLGEKWKGQSGLWRTTDGRLYLVINLPLLAEHTDDPLGRVKGELLWPDWFRAEDAKRLQEAAKKGGAQARTWSSLYQQRPAPNEGAILAKHYWRPWTKSDLPEVEQVFLCYDTAFEEGEENDFSAMSAWGVFEHTSRKPTGEEYKHKHVILLGYWQDRVSAVDLMDIIVHGTFDEMGRKVPSHCQLFKPDRVLIEKGASGIQLLQEMKRKRIPVRAWLPKGKPGQKGKLPRAHAIAVILEQGSVWYVPGSKTEMLLEQCAAFPYGTHDDGTDTVTMALAYFRDRYIFQTHEDELDESELKEALLQRSDERRSGRSLYGARSGSRDSDYDQDDIERMTPATRRKLWGAVK